MSKTNSAGASCASAADLQAIRQHLNEQQAKADAAVARALFGDGPLPDFASFTEQTALEPYALKVERQCIAQRQAADLADFAADRKRDRQALIAPKPARKLRTNATAEAIGKLLAAAEVRLVRGGLSGELPRSAVAAWLVSSADAGLGELTTADNLRDKWLAGKGYLKDYCVKGRPQADARDAAWRTLDTAWRQGREVEAEASDAVNLHKGGI